MIETEEQALLNAILATPDDVAPRLIYADWLDEHDRPEQAKFIRQSFRLLWERYAYGKWRWYHERQGSDGAKYWYPNALEQPRPAWYPANFPLFPQTWRRNLNSVILRNGFVSELGVDRFHSNTFRLLETQPVTTVTTTAEALLNVIDMLREEKKEGRTSALREIRLTNWPEGVSVRLVRNARHITFPNTERTIRVPRSPLDGQTDDTLTAYYFNRVITHYLTPHGITVQLPPIQ